MEWSSEEWLQKLQGMGSARAVPDAWWAQLRAHLRATDTFVAGSAEARRDLCDWWSTHGGEDHPSPPTMDPRDRERWTRVARQLTWGSMHHPKEGPLADHPHVAALFLRDPRRLPAIADDATLHELLRGSGLAHEPTRAAMVIALRGAQRGRAAARAAMRDEVRWTVPPRLRLDGKWSVAGFEELLPSVGRCVRRSQRTRQMLLDWLRRRRAEADGTMSMMSHDHRTSSAPSLRLANWLRVGSAWQRVGCEAAGDPRLRSICEDFVRAGLAEVAGVAAADAYDVDAAWAFVSQDPSGVRMRQWFGMPDPAATGEDPDVIFSDDPSAAVVYPRPRSWALGGGWHPSLGTAADDVQLRRSGSTPVPVKLYLCAHCGRTRSVYEDTLRRWILYVLRVCPPIHDDEDLSHPLVRALLLRG